MLAANVIATHHLTVINYLKTIEYTSRRFSPTKMKSLYLQFTTKTEPNHLCLKKIWERNSKLMNNNLIRRLNVSEKCVLLLNMFVTELTPRPPYNNV